MADGRTPIKDDIDETKIAEPQEEVAETPAEPSSVVNFLDLVEQEKEFLLDQTKESASAEAISAEDANEDSDIIPEVVFFTTVRIIPALLSFCGQLIYPHRGGTRKLKRRREM